MSEEAVRLTPEPSAERSQRTLSVAEYLVLAGRTTDAVVWLDQLLGDDTARPLHARARLLRTGAVEHDIDAARMELADLLQEAGDDLRLRSQILLGHSSYLAYCDDLEASERAAREALSAAQGAGDKGLEALALARIADRLHDLGHPDPDLLDRAVALAEQHGTPSPFVTPRCTLAELMMRDADLEGARAAFTIELESARDAGAHPLRGRILVLLTDLECRAGRWELARHHIEEAWDLVLDAGGDLWEEGEILQRQARLAALRGDAERARVVVAECSSHAASMHWELFTAMNSWVLGFLELSLGDHGRAWSLLHEVVRIPTYRRPEVLEALADAVETLVGLARVAEADDLLGRLRADAASGHSWAQAAAERCSALLLLAHGDAAGALAAAEDAVERFERAGFPLDGGRARVVAGDALRRLGERRRAAEHLEAAASIFSGLGASLWQTRAERELRRAQPRPRRDGELTNAERRVAAEVASGKTNREVAATLFTSVATVEAHLTRIYAKIGVRSRTELTRRVADGSMSLSEE
jgi:DNA-binding CsgD family transcriptional regulator